MLKAANTDLFNPLVPNDHNRVSKSTMFQSNSKNWTFDES